MGSYVFSRSVPGYAMRKKIRSGMGKRFPRTCVSKMRRRTKSSMEFADDELDLLLDGLENRLRCGSKTRRRRGGAWCSGWWWKLLEAA